MARRRVSTAANAVMLLLFIGFAAVQWNDPDGHLWMALYAMAAVSCALALARVLPWRLAAAVGLIALVWAVLLAPGVLAHPPDVELFASYRMMSPAVEETRELFGLLIVVAWMATLGTASRRQTTPWRG
jgi:hypothetical protein